MLYNRQRRSARLTAEPTLYNMFMDTFAESLDTTPARASKEPCKMFADDVKLSAVKRKSAAKATLPCNEMGQGKHYEMEP